MIHLPLVAYKAPPSSTKDALPRLFWIWCVSMFFPLQYVGDYGYGIVVPIGLFVSAEGRSRPRYRGVECTLLQEAAAVSANYRKLR